MHPPAAIISPKHRAFALPYDAGLASLVPQAKEFMHPERGRMILLPHEQATTRLARNMGFTVPAPILAQYDWVGSTPFRTQQVTAAMLTMQPRAFVLNEMGTGKTRATLFALDWLIRIGEVRRVLVVAPLSTLSIVWDREIFQYFPHLTTAVLHGTRAKRHDMLASDKHIYIVNHDGVELILKEVLERGDIDCVVIDELAVYRNARTARWKALNPIVSKAKFAWGLTGSPTPGEPTDAWGQVKMLRPTQVPKYFKEFQRDTMIQVSPFRWVPKKEANEKVFSVMQPCVRFTRDDCVELPDTSYQTRETPLSTQQQKIHDEMIKKLRLEFAQGRVTAANEGVLVSKLLQICAGWVYTQDRRVIALDNKPRLQALQDFLDEAEGKVIVFGSYIHVVENLFDIIKKSGRTCSMVHGGTPGGQRNAIFSAFNQDPDPRILVAHPGCMAHGLTLTSASVTVWFTPAPSLEIYEQANARMTRPGQEKKTVIAHLTGSKTESKLYQRLRQRASVQGALLEMFENQEVG